MPHSSIINNFRSLTDKQLGQLERGQLSSLGLLKIYSQNAKRPIAASCNGCGTLDQILLDSAYLPTFILIHFRTFLNKCLLTINQRCSSRRQHIHIYPCFHNTAFLALRHTSCDNDPAALELDLAFFPQHKLDYL